MGATAKRKVTLQTLAKKVQNKERIVGMECHDTPSAMMAEELGMDLLCCGSPGPMGLMGHTSMDTVDFEEQLYMLQGVLRGAKTPFIICNMPNTTACVSVEEAIRNAARITHLGADGVHIEPTKGMMPMLRGIATAGIPIIGHFGVQGERRLMYGYQARGKTAADAASIVELIESSIEAGIATVLLEHASEELTKWCFENLPVPVASLRSGPYANGIFHVSSDIIGCSTFPIPPGGEIFGNVWQNMLDAYRAYFNAAKSGKYPKPEYSYHMNDDEREKFMEAMARRKQRHA
jgi:3-methyl-2-oxobutanoate hydroxymethyltransferase